MPQLAPPSRIFTSLIQGDFDHDGHGNLEAVIRTGGELWHWFRDGSRGNGWFPAQKVTDGAVGAGSLIRSDFSDGEHGNFEVVVPLDDGAGGSDLWHFFRENSDVTTPWVRAQRVAADVTGPGCLIQSDFGDGEHGNFEVVVPIRNAAGGSDLWHLFHDNSDLALPWQRAQLVAADVTGPGCLIQSDFTHDGDRGNFEVVVPIRNAAGGSDLWHVFHDNTDVALPWQRAQLVAADVAGPGVLIQSDFGDGDHGNFEVVVPLARGDGLQLRHWFRENADPGTPWRRGQFVTDACSGPGCLIQGDFGFGGHGNFELLVQECSQSVVGYWHPNDDVAWPWLRHRTVLGEPEPHRLERTRRIVQLTGEYDRTGWDGTGTPPFAHNRTESAYQIRGTDLGVSFPHRDRTYFLFGDTWRVNQPPDWVNLDLVAFTTDPDPEDGLDLTFFHTPPRISGGIGQREFDVPLDGVSAGASALVFFSTDHVRVQGYDLMGRSVLTRCDDDGFAFTLLAEVSRYKFVNVSVERARIDPGTAERIGLPGHTDVLWIWGSGRYRSSDVYLAVTPFEAAFEGRPQLRFFAGSRSRWAWSWDEEDATALFANGSIGELSVRWNPFVQRWFATFNSENPRGILLHDAPNPWGPWSRRPVRVFDPGHLRDPGDPCSGDGYGAFMHTSWDERRCDHVQDDMFDPGSFRDNDWGGEYGPYQLANYARAAQDGGTLLYFTMSTWNPYQAMLMSTVVTPHDLRDD